MQQETALAAPFTDRSKRRGQLWREIVKNRWAYAFISPFFILFAVFALFPVLFSIYLAFHQWSGYGPMEFVGLKNFAYVFGVGGKVFWKSISNGVILFFMYVPIQTFVAIVLAVILNSGMVRFFQGYRTMIYAPRVTSMVAAGFTFRLMLEMKGGLFNVMLGAIGLPDVPWLESVWWSRVSLCLLVVWGWLGQNMVYMLAGLQTIPRELTEAALIDGCSPAQALFRITIPLLRPVIVFAVILSTMGSFGLFAEVQTLTWGGRPMRATLTTLVHLYGVAFGDFRFGRASGLAYVYFALVFVLSLLQVRYFGREE
jgi:ABC-type sugar transport system permease subunit